MDYDISFTNTKIWLTQMYYLILDILTHLFVEESANVGFGHVIVALSAMF